MKKEDLVGDSCLLNRIVTPDGTTLISRYNAGGYVSHIDKITGKTYKLSGGHKAPTVDVNGVHDFENSSVYVNDPFERKRKEVSIVYMSNTVYTIKPVREISDIDLERTIQNIAYTLKRSQDNIFPVSESYHKKFLDLLTEEKEYRENLINKKGGR